MAETTRTDAKTISFNMNKAIALDSRPENLASARVEAVIKMVNSGMDRGTINAGLREVVLAPDSRRSSEYVKRTAINNITDMDFLKGLSDGSIAMGETTPETKRQVVERAGILYRTYTDSPRLRAE